MRSRLQSLVEKELASMLDQDTIALIHAGIHFDYLVSLYRSMSSVIGREHARKIMMRLARSVDKQAPHIGIRIRAIIGEPS